MPGNDVFGDLEQRRQRVDQIRENTPRLARAYATYETQGWGEIIVPTVQHFGCTFITEPYFSSGIVMRGDSTSEADGQLVSGRYPRVTAGIWRWAHDARGYWIGAYVFFVVETVGFQFTSGEVPSSVDPNYRIAHKMIFEGVSFKDFNVNKLDY